MKSKLPAAPLLPQRLTLVSQTIESLRQGIESGHWQDWLPAERQLGEQLQVSRRTLRSALEELQRQGWLEVSGRQRRRIKQHHATAASPARRKLISILAPSSFLALPSPISYIMDTLRSRLTTAGYEVQFHVNPACYEGSPSGTLARFLAQHPSTVWLFLSAQAPMQKWLATQKLPCIILGSALPGLSLPSVDTDFHAACHHAAGQLWRKGHRRIALVLPKVIFGGDIASEEGLRDAIKTMPGARMCVLRHDTTTPGLCALLDDTLNRPDPPTAYIVARAAHTITVMMHLMRRGQKIPRDVAVIARDNDPALEGTSPPVSRYAIEPRKLASRIVRAVRQLAESGLIAEPAIRLMPSFIAGESV